MRLEQRGGVAIAFHVGLGLRRDYALSGTACGAGSGDGSRRTFSIMSFLIAVVTACQELSHSEILRLGVTVGSLQVICSRLGISLRMPKMFERRRRVKRFSNFFP